MVNLYEIEKLAEEGKEIDELDKQITETKGGTKISDKDKNMPEAQRSMLEQGIRGLGDSLSQAERDEFYNSFLKQKVFDAQKKEQQRVDNLSFVGKMLETLKTDANARQKFFDQLGGIGAEISRPTEPGEARSLVRDVIVGSERGEGKTIAKRKASAEMMADAALAQQRANPMQYYTTAMKELTQQAIAEGFQPGTLAFTKYVGAKLRDQGISEQALTYSEVLKNLNEQLLTAQATGEQEKIDQILQQISQTQNLLNTVLGGTSTGASNVVSYKPQ